MRHWRKMTWVLLGWVGLIVLWIVVGAKSAIDETAAAACAAESDGFLTVEDCTAAQEIGTGIGVALILGLGFVGFVVLSIVWFMTRPREQVIVRVLDQPRV